MNGVEWNGEEEVEEEKFWLQQSRGIDDAWGKEVLLNYLFKPIDHAHQKKEKRMGLCGLPLVSFTSASRFHLGPSVGC